MLLTAGAVSSVCAHKPHEIVWVYALMYLACWMAAWEAYWIGRLAGPELFRIRWFRRLLTPQRLEFIKSSIQRYGFGTFIVGRFIPGGRNALFMSTGLVKMPFSSFVLRDSIGCLLSSGLLFSLGHIFGDNIQTIIAFIQLYERIFIGLVICVILAIAAFFYYRHRSTA